ncbi:hypothetical protein GCM10018791_58410 [Streptomyces zaomyceticus]|nr:hypothetical protein GCM10018791_58410 [Streptomyces zaomyceticus]
MAYVWPSWWVPWLGVRSAGLLSADQCPATGGSTSTVARGALATRLPAVLASTNPSATAATAGSHPAMYGYGGSTKHEAIACTTNTSQSVRWRTTANFREDIRTSP